MDGEKLAEINDMLFDEESIDQLSPEQKMDVIQIVIKNILNGHPEGLTVNAISEISGITSRTIKKHLDILSATRQIYLKKYSQRLQVYFPPLNKESSSLSSKFTIGESTFILESVNNSFGEFIYIQERKKDSFGNSVKTVGGIMVPMEGVPKFIEQLSEMIDLQKNGSDYSISR